MSEAKATSLSTNVGTHDVGIIRGFNDDNHPYFKVDGYAQSQHANPRDPYLDLIQSVTLVQPRIFDDDDMDTSNGNDHEDTITVRFLGSDGPTIDVPNHDIDSLMWLQDYELEDLCYEIAAKAIKALNSFENTITIKSHTLLDRLHKHNVIEKVDK